MTELPIAAPVPITSLSPTAANDLLACPYRLAWRLDPRFKSLRRPSPSSSLGVVAHAVVEDLAKGLLRGAASDTDARTRVEACWSDHVAKAMSVLNTRWAPVSPPQPEDWPGYHLVRARTLRRARRRFGQPAPASPAARPLVEESFDAPAAGLSGRPDRVEGSPGDLCVVDLKTGLAQAGPTARQRLQLLVYCHLVGAATGDVPTRVAIEDPSGRRWEESVSRDEIAAVVAEVQAARGRYEAAAASSEGPMMASPGPDTCRYCPYRTVCGPYWESLETSWEHPSVAGHVTEVRASKQGSTVLVDATAPVDGRGPGWLVTAAPADAVPELGLMTLVDAESTGAARHLRWRWSTLTWPPARPT